VAKFKVNCSECGVLILNDTSKKTEGVYMPCFMKLNDGLRPAELSSLKGRGLYEYFNRWNAFVKKGVPKIKRNRKVVDKLNHYLPLINASISGYLRFGNGSFEGKQNSNYITELKVQSDSEMLLFLTEVERFNAELMSVTKT